MPIRSLFILACLLSLCTTHAQVTMTKNGTPTSRILFDSEVEADSIAAHLLQRFIGEISGAQLPLKEASTTAPQANDILIGEFQRTDWPVEAGTIPDLQEDGFFLTTKGGNLRILSGGDKGSIYAAVTLLDDYLGMDYYAKDTYTLTEQDSIQLPALSEEDHPAFRYRQTFSYGLEDPVYRWWFRIESPDEEFADRLWVHTFDRLIPSAVYGEAHPEYYSFINGERRPGKASQWCLTNPDVLDLATRKLDSIFRANPEEDMISVSQNDGNFTYCRCDACAAIDEHEGSPSGTLIHFMNKLAERFPDKTISTLAYLYSMQPPKHVKPLPNVNIMLCSIDAKREVPLTDNASGRDFVRALEGWAAISDNIFVWDYGINFDNLVSPFPNFHVLQPNMELFHTNNVTMHFAQVGGKRGEDFSELRAYMLCRLLWNPYQDTDELMLEFMTGYYGAAGHYLYQYQKELQKALAKYEVPLWIYDSPVSHKEGMLNQDLRLRYNQLFDQAEKAVNDQPALLDRVHRSRLPLQYADLEIARTNPDRDPQRLSVLLDTFQARTARFQVATLNERNNAPDDYCRLYRSRYLNRPQGNVAKGASVRWLQAPHDRYQELADTALTDELFGGTTFAESWVGWEGTDGSFILDLGEPQLITSISTDFLHQLGAWILLPKSVTYSVSTNGKDFGPFGKKELAEDRDREVKFVPVAVQAQKPTVVRYIKVEIEGMKVCPPWHYGVGYPAWFFLDEVLVR